MHLFCISFIFWNIAQAILCVRHFSLAFPLMHLFISPARFAPSLRNHACRLLYTQNTCNCLPGVSVALTCSLLANNASKRSSWRWNATVRAFRRFRDPRCAVGRGVTFCVTQTGACCVRVIFLWAFEHRSHHSRQRRSFKQNAKNITRHVLLGGAPQVNSRAAPQVSILLANVKTIASTMERQAPGARCVRCA